MDCKTCQDLLVEYVSGTLAPRLAAEVDDELARCPTCRQSHTRLLRGHELAVQLPIAPVPEGLHARIMAGAQAELDARAVAHARSQAHDGARLQRWLRSLGQLVMGRQVAMATIMVLIAVGTSWIIPELRRAPQEADVAIVSTEDAYPTLVEEVAAAPDSDGFGASPASIGAVEEGGAAQPAAEESAGSQPAEAKAAMARRGARKPAAGASAERSKAQQATRARRFSKVAAGKRPASKGRVAAKPKKRAPSGALGGASLDDFAPAPPAPSRQSTRAEPISDARGSRGAATMDDLAGPSGAVAEQEAPASPPAPSDVAASRRRTALQALGRDCKAGLRQFDALAADKGLGEDRTLVKAAIACMEKVGRTADAARWQRSRLGKPAK